MDSYKVGHFLRHIVYCADIELVKDSNMLRLPSDRYSPVRRLSDGLTSVRKYRSQLEKIYKKALQNQVLHSAIFTYLLQLFCNFSSSAILIA